LRFPACFSPALSRRDPFPTSSLKSKRWTSPMQEPQTRSWRTLFLRHIDGAFWNPVMNPCCPAQESGSPFLSRGCPRLRSVPLLMLNGCHFPPLSPPSGETNRLILLRRSPPARLTCPPSDFAGLFLLRSLWSLFFFGAAVWCCLCVCVWVCFFFSPFFGVGVFFLCVWVLVFGAAFDRIVSSQLLSERPLRSF